MLHVLVSLLPAVAVALLEISTKLSDCMKRVLIYLEEINRNHGESTLLVSSIHTGRYNKEETCYWDESGVCRCCSL